MAGAARTLSKSKLMAYRQCPKRLWLEVHRPELRDDTSATQASFKVGYEIGEIARRIYDPEGLGILVDIETEGFWPAMSRSAQLLASVRQPVFEAGLKAEGALAFADVMLPVESGGDDSWRMVEVKSAASLKDYYRDDLAIQAYIARRAGVKLAAAVLAHVDSQWVYPGKGDYSGLLVECDLTSEVNQRDQEVSQWLSDARDIIGSDKEPDIGIGNHCDSPYACGFYGHCSRDIPAADYPLAWLPYFGSKAAKLHEQGIMDIRDVPDDLLNERQQRVKNHTLNGTAFFDCSGAQRSLAGHTLPAYFLDFETIQFTVPIWAGTSPYQQIPFQFSLHILNGDGSLYQHGFLDLTGNNPCQAFAETLIRLCGQTGPVYVYNAGFETSRIRDLARMLPEMAEPLLAIIARVVDLLPIARDFYYHPSQQGSWSIKKVLPAVAPELRYDDLDGVQDGGMAMEAFVEAIHPQTSDERREQIRLQLLAYCSMDTYAMVKLWQFFSGFEGEIRFCSGEMP